VHNLINQPSGDIPTALVVDVDSRNLYEICKAFRELGYRTFGATSFSDAKRFLIADHPEIMVADVRLGEFNGIQLLLLARELRPRTAVVITNPSTDSVLAAETQRMGGTFMVKPIDVAELIDVVRQKSSRATGPDRRTTDRRVVYTTHFSPDRRVAERRRT
jgi:DNA-binding response OmpR family regulator